MAHTCGWYEWIYTDNLGEWVVMMLSIDPIYVVARS
jgi:hypothetical protein